MIGRVTPRIVSSPSPRNESWLRVGRMPVERYVIVGCVAASKKFSDRRSLSRVSLPVSTDDRSMVAVAEDSRGFGAVMIWASNLVKRPWTLLTMRWRGISTAWDVIVDPPMRARLISLWTPSSQPIRRKHIGQRIVGPVADRDHRAEWSGLPPDARRPVPRTRRYP